MSLERKKCSTCGKYLIALKGEKSPIYLHPDAPCSGTTDAIMLTVEVADESLDKIWTELYGIPEMTDYKRLDYYEQQIKTLTEYTDNLKAGLDSQAKWIELIKSKWILRLLIKWLV